MIFKGKEYDAQQNYPSLVENGYEPHDEPEPLPKPIEGFDTMLKMRHKDRGTSYIVLVREVANEH